MTAKPPNIIKSAPKEEWYYSVTGEPIHVSNPMNRKDQIDIPIPIISPDRVTTTPQREGKIYFGNSTQHRK